MKVALITGITGQDGAYLAEFLLNIGYVVHGIKRRSSLINTARVDHLYQEPDIKNQSFHLHHGDMTDACLHLIDISKNKIKKIISPRQSHINIGSGNEVTIKQLATKIAKIIGYKGKIVFDKSYPDGTPRKKLNLQLSKSYGWKAKTSLSRGFDITFKDFLKKYSKI